MEFGKVLSEQLDTIDLRLPADDPRTWVTLRKKTGVDARVGVGAPVWGTKEWLGRIYPVGTAPTDFLYHYARQFNAIELNTTHYRIPDRSTIERWREVTPASFRFCPKFPKEISHHAPLSMRAVLIREFVTSVMGLEDRLGLSFLQLPPYFSPDDLRELSAFLKLLPQGFRIAVEVRHPAFFHEHLLSNRLFDLLAGFGATAVITDVTGRRDVLHTSLPAGRVLVRFIGNDLHATDYARAEAWVERLANWLKLGLEEVEFFIHQPGDRTAPDLIGHFIDRMNAVCGLSLANWTARDEGEQLGFF